MEDFHLANIAKLLASSSQHGMEHGCRILARISSQERRFDYGTMDLDLAIEQVENDDDQKHDNAKSANTRCNRCRPNIKFR